MIIGVPKEAKCYEYRVGLTPQSVREVGAHGHTVLVERSAGQGIGASDELYIAAGATIVETPAELFERANLIIKVKEPQSSEWPLLRSGQVLFCYLHLAADKALTQALCDSGATCIAYETVADTAGRLPLLAPMSQVAGRIAVQVGARNLENPTGGRGVLLGGVPGVPPAKVVVLGGGVVGANAVAMALGAGADVHVLEKDVFKINQLVDRFGLLLKTAYSSRSSIEEHCADADLVIGGVLNPGALAPKLIQRDTIRTMRRGSVFVDVAIDQGGCSETSRPTTHDNPTYVVDGITHYCVTNMPGAVGRTSTYALNNVTLPFALAIANKGFKDAMLSDPQLLAGLNIFDGNVTQHAVSEATCRPFLEARCAIA